MSPACCQCGKPLRARYLFESKIVNEPNGHRTDRVRGRLRGYGYAARGCFCSLRCGWEFAIQGKQLRKPRREDRLGSSTLFCTCGESFTWSGLPPESMGPWTKEHLPHLSGLNQKPWAPSKAKAKGHF